MKSFFWGIFLVSSGLFLMLKHYFNWNIPTARVLIGLFLVSLGLSLLIGGVGYRDQSNIILNEGRLNIGARAKDYNIVFGQAVLDFSDVSLEELDKKIELNTVFGSAEIVLPKDAAVEIKANSAFSSTRLPDGTNLSFGDRTYLSDPQGKGQADFTLEINTVFGSTEIRH
ncbi:MAG: LiaF domain-containing protein [Caldicoprobacterales bacterium]|jgi:multisubunit Na+/H+ antiporter MnhC subunit|nr:cell wall-active antibiotics response protein [Clostridiales bacterium]